MDLKFEVRPHFQDSLNSCTSSLSKIVKLFENGRNFNKENVNEINEEGNMLLHRVVQNQNVHSPAIVSFLLKEGALVSMTTRNQVGKQDRTALHIATQNMTDYSLDIVKILLQNNSPAVNAKDDCGITPLFYAVANKQECA